jgi:hypothetical protein
MMNQTRWRSTNSNGASQGRQGQVGSEVLRRFPSHDAKGIKVEDHSDI